jgi:ribosome-binding factor A
LQSGIAELLLRDVKDPRIGMVTVTGVDVSPDLKHARVYVAPHGDAEVCARALAGLRSARAYLQAQVGRRLRLRFTPELRFELDESLDRVARLDELLSGADRDDAESD